MTGRAVRAVSQSKSCSEAYKPLRLQKIHATSIPSSQHTLSYLGRLVERNKGEGGDVVGVPIVSGASIHPHLGALQAPVDAQRGEVRLAAQAPSKGVAWASVPEQRA